MNELNVKIADETFYIEYSDPAVPYWFTGFTIESRGEIPLCPTDRDLEKIRADFIRTDSRRFSELPKRPPAQLEFHTIHYLMAKSLLKRGVLLVHGSAVAADGNAYLFIAPSGMGKSTHTALWKEVLGERAFIINDDKPLIRLSGGVPLIYPTPWGMVKDSIQAESAPLRAIIWLERGEKNEIEPIDEGKMFMQIYKASLMGENADEVAAILALQKKLLNKTKLFHLKCKADKDAAITALNALLYTDS